MNCLYSLYNDTKAPNKLPFNVEKVKESLMSEPLNIDISQIVFTPSSVIVKKTRDEYLNEKIATVIKNKYNVDVSCRTDMLIFS